MPHHFLKRSRAARRPLYGMTIPEVLVASVILSVALITLVSAWVHMVRISIGTDDRAAAYEVGRLVLERARSVGYHTTLPATWSTDVNGNNGTPNLAGWRFFDSEQRELGATNTDPPPQPFPSGTHFLVRTISRLSPNSSVPTGRDDLHLLTFDVTVFLVDGQGNKSDELARFQTCLTQGGI